MYENFDGSLDGHSESYQRIKNGSSVIDTPQPLCNTFATRIQDKKSVSYPVIFHLYKKCIDYIEKNVHVNRSSIRKE